MTLQAKRERVAGLDLIRILAMLMVVTSHACIFHFKTVALLDQNSPDVLSYVCSCVYSAIGVDGVNLYALLTGYLCINAKWHADRFVGIWMQAAFYGVGLYALWFILNQVGICPQEVYLDKQGIIKILTLLGAGEYWYVVAYAGLFFLIPFINKLIHSLDKTGLRWLLIACIGISATVGWMSQPITAMGYSTFWLASLYVLGAYLRLHQPTHRPVVYGLLLATSLLIKAILIYYNFKFVVVYTSVFCIAEACLLFMIVCNIRIQNKVLSRTVIWLGICSFGVYLVHSHPFSMYLAKECIRHFHLGDMGNVWWVLPIWCMALYLVCAIVDQLRAWLFSLLRAQRACKWISDTGTFLLAKIAAK